MMKIYHDGKLEIRNVFKKLSAFAYMVQSTQEICGRQSLKNFTWSILEYFVPYTALTLYSLFIFVACKCEFYGRTRIDIFFRQNKLN